MKHYEEIANRVFERRDAYVARQKKRRQAAIRMTSVASAFVLVALLGVGVWQSGWLTPDVPMVEEPVATAPTTAPTENLDGTGGDCDECDVHNYMYHRIDGSFTNEQAELYDELIGDKYYSEENNIVTFVNLLGITREEYIASQGWTEDTLDEIPWFHGPGCPYTKRQFVDAIYGDDPELTAWVFAPYTTWPEPDTWSLIGEEGLCPEDWPPEGYGFGETRPSEIAE